MLTCLTAFLYFVKKEKGFSFLDGDIEIIGNFQDYHADINVSLKETLDSFVAFKVYLCKVLELLSEVSDGG